MLIQNKVWRAYFSYVMRENWIFGCCGLNEDVGDRPRHLGHTENEHKKTVL